MKQTKTSVLVDLDTEVKVAKGKKTIDTPKKVKANKSVKDIDHKEIEEVPSKPKKVKVKPKAKVENIEDTMENLKKEFLKEIINSVEPSIVKKENIFKKILSIFCSKIFKRH